MHFQLAVRTVRNLRSTPQRERCTCHSLYAHSREPAFVVAHGRALERPRSVRVTEHRKLHVLKAHVGAEPGGTVLRLALVAFGCSGGRERGTRGEMRLAQECRVVACARERAGKAALTHPRIEVNPVVPYAVRERKLPGQYGGARRLTHEIRRDARGEARAVPREPVDVRHADVGILETVAVRALLVGGDEEDVRLSGHGRCQMDGY